MDDSRMEKAVLSSKITLSLTVAEINQILSIVGRYPFDEVQLLVHRIQEQGQPQINDIITKLKAEVEVPPAAV